MSARPGGALPRLEFRIERLRTTLRFTYAFHAREVRFERESEGTFIRVFPETFSFHPERHDPAELYLRLEDLWSNPTRTAPEANRRDSEDAMMRLLAALPGYLSGIVDHFEAGGPSASLQRVCEDVSVFAQLVSRFIAEKGLEEHPRLRNARFHIRKLTLRVLLLILEERVAPGFVDRYIAGEADPEPASGDPNDIGFFYALASGDPDRIDRAVMGAAERAYFRWVEDVCLDEENRAFETEQSPFDEREVEVLRTVTVKGRSAVSRGADFSPFLRRPHNRDCRRLLKKLETWFLRQYDIRHAAAVLHHHDHLIAGRDDTARLLSLHTTRTYAVALLLLAAPFLGAIFAYDAAPMLFDAAASAEVIVVTAVAFWFLAYRFMWKKDLTFFHASVPRIGAGIIVGYLPVFLIDEVWDLAEQSPFYLTAVATLLGSTTLLYLYVEVQRRIGDPRESFARARRIFLLGLVEAAGFGMVVTSLLGPLMALRNWGVHEASNSLELLSSALPPFLGELPRIVGIPPFSAFPSAVFLMSFLAFFIGTFLQLLWEDLPITEPL
jgi:hypothetical protein